MAFFDESNDAIITAHRKPVGAAARCDLLRLILKSGSKDRSLVALDSSYRGNAVWLFDEIDDAIATAHRKPAGAAARCDLLRLIVKNQDQEIAASLHSAAPTGDLRCGGLTR
ncbi:hypothetical protein [Pseudomonas sp.]|uniref:hypothetical protein n=1 Tax=Pseudomonas sp. TaxID=306 RepID=UPI002E36210D|nr:hypothetical protein [Pseudomonas sp.]HEX4549013.1 hypothetical protein [Pseudomonas sp.]